MGAPKFEEEDSKALLACMCARDLLNKDPKPYSVEVTTVPAVAARLRLGVNGESVRYFEAQGLLASGDHRSPRLHNLGTVFTMRRLRGRCGTRNRMVPPAPQLGHETRLETVNIFLDSSSWRLFSTTTHGRNSRGHS
eukprot:GHVU01077258.1.p1 GENE.GHVU01077258.1~~GHVU01077258.1.p1  ORF type:complete len:137 (+),score=14.52 GHVU01077258.1:215-625(+)